MGRFRGEQKEELLNAINLASRLHTFAAAELQGGCFGGVKEDFFFFCFSCSFAFVSWVWKGKLISCKTGKGSLSSTHKKSSLFRNHLPKIACKLCHFHIKALFIPNCFFWLHFWNRHFEGYCLNHYPKKICIL